MLALEIIKSVFAKKEKFPVYQVRNGSKRFKTSVSIKITTELNNDLSEQTIKKSESYKLVLTRQNKEINIFSNKTIIENASDLGIELKYSCATGGCGACKVKMISGKVNMDSPNCLSDSEKEEGYILACVSYLSADTILDT